MACGGVEFDAVRERGELVAKPAELGDGEVGIVDADEATAGAERRGDDAARVRAGDLDLDAWVELRFDLLGVAAVGGEEGAPARGEKRGARRSAETCEIADVVEIGDEKSVEFLSVGIGGEVLEDPRAAGGEVGSRGAHRKMPPPLVLWPSLIAA